LFSLLPEVAAGSLCLVLLFFSWLLLHVMLLLLLLQAFLSRMGWDGDAVVEVKLAAAAAGGAAKCSFTARIRAIVQVSGF
jgi:hypothetical protein